MKIKINTKDLNKMVKAVKKCISKDERLPLFKNIKIESKNNILRMVTVDGYKLAMYECEIIEGEDFECLIPAFEIPKNAELTTIIEYINEKVYIDFGCYKICYNTYKEKYFDYNYLIDESKYNFKIGLNANYLKDILLSSPDNKIEININTNDSINPILIKNVDNNSFKAICLPIKLKENEVKISNKCLHCGKEITKYCESCYQEIITKNAELQLENQNLKEKLQNISNFINK